MKKILRSPTVVAVLAALFALYGRFLFLTCRVRVVTPTPTILHQSPVILATWHQQIIMLPLIHRPSPTRLLAMMSGSRDGTLIRRVAAWFGIGAAVGSSHRGAVAGARALVQAARNGHSLFITPDGPRGPARVAKPGVTEVARLTNLPVIPTAAWPHRGKTFNSWDSFRIPHPFSTISVAYGEPLTDLTPESLQAALNTLTAQAQGAGALATGTPKL